MLHTQKNTQWVMHIIELGVQMQEGLCANTLVAMCKYNKGVRAKAIVAVQVKKTRQQTDMPIQ